MVYSIVQYIFNLATDTLRLTFVFVRLCMFFVVSSLSLALNRAPAHSRDVCERERVCVCVFVSVFFFLLSSLSIALSLALSVSLSLSRHVQSDTHIMSHLSRHSWGHVLYLERSLRSRVSAKTHQQE